MTQTKNQPPRFVPYRASAASCYPPLLFRESLPPQNGRDRARKVSPRAQPQPRRVQCRSIRRGASPLSKNLSHLRAHAEMAVSNRLRNWRKIAIALIVPEEKHFPVG